MLGTRPEAIKLFPVIRALRGDAAFETLVCATGQHRELLASVLDLAGIGPDFDLDVMCPGQDLGELTAALLTRIGAVLDEVRPDCVLVQGDTASAMAASMSAFYRRIPVAHVEAGLRSGDMGHPFPEELNRRVVSLVAAVHFAPTERSAQILRREGVATDRIHVTGQTGIDALVWMRARLAAEPGLAPGLAEVEGRFAGKRLIAVTCHRRENIGAGAEAICEAIAQLAARGDCAFVLPLHPNPAVQGPVRKRLEGLDHVALTEALDYPHFVRLLDRAHIILTDSGGVQEEAPLLGKPILVLRETTERPEGVAEGAARVIGTEAGRIVAECARLLDDPTAHAAMAQVRTPYGDGRAAGRIVDLLRGRLGTT